MIKHVVIWKLKEQGSPSERLEHARRMKRDIEALKEQIPEIERLEVGLTMCDSRDGGDVALYSEFASMADLDIYQNHPAHQAVVAFVREVATDRSVVDYEV